MMTEDEWSLKGKKEIGYGMCVAPPEIYLADDIETLRQKLIEDANKAWTHILGCIDKSNREYWFYTEWLTSINKRFGVE
jgi:hypothetical protein